MEGTGLNLWNQSRVPPLSHTQKESTAPEITYLKFHFLNQQENGGEKIYLSF